jgi:hypothetical protein
MRTVRVPVEVYQPLEDLLAGHFFTDVFGWKPDEDLRRRCALPTRHGGLGIPIVTELAVREWAAAGSLTAPLAEAIYNQQSDYVGDPRAARFRRAERLMVRDKACAEEADELARGLTGRAARGFQEARLDGGSAWLAVVPLESLGLDLDSLTFRDAVALRFGLPLPEALPQACPSCGQDMSVDHALKCKKGGWVSKRHQAVLRAWKRYLEMAGVTPLFEEPYLIPVRHGAAVRPGTTKALDARADLVGRGVFAVGKDAYFDIVVVDTGAASYGNRPTMNILESHERRKRTEYEDRITPLGSFTPLACSVYGTLGPAATMTAHRVARRYDEGREERDAVLDLHHVLIQTAVLKATSLCLRGRSWLVMPQAADVGELEDPSQALADAGVRADI